MSWPKVLAVRAWAPTLEGAGETLTLKFTGYSSTKRGAERWRGEIELNVDRHMVRKLAEQIREMQTRDRDRLAYERARLDREVEPLTRPADSQEKT